MEDTNKEKEYVSANLKEECKKWKLYDSVYIMTPTGSGKTTFILKDFYKYIIEYDAKLFRTAPEQQRIHDASVEAFKTDYMVVIQPEPEQERKILYLVNREVLKKQILEELFQIQTELEGEYLEEGIDIRRIISIMTYQELEEKIVNNSYEITNYLSEYYYIIADECHYFYTDSLFNAKTQLSYKAITDTVACKIFMSATIERIAEYTQKVTKGGNSIYHIIYHVIIGEESKSYSMKTDYSYVDFNYFRENEELIDLVNHSGKEKWLIFVDSKKEGKKIKSKLKKGISVFITADNKEDEDSEGQKRKLARNRKADYQVIISTSVLDNGISIIDEKLKNIVVTANTKEEFLQMLGRKRKVAKDEKVTLYVKKKTKGYFQAQLRQVESKIKFLHQWGIGICKPPDIVLSQCLSSPWYYHCSKDLCYLRGGWVYTNSFADAELLYLRKCYNEIIQKFDERGEDAFVWIQANWLGFKEDEIEDYLKSAKQKEYERLYNTITGYIEFFFKLEPMEDAIGTKNTKEITHTSHTEI